MMGKISMWWVISSKMVWTMETFLEEASKKCRSLLWKIGRWHGIQTSNQRKNCWSRLVELTACHRSSAHTPNDRLTLKSKVKARLVSTTTNDGLNKKRLMSMTIVSWLNWNSHLSKNQSIDFNRLKRTSRWSLNESLTGIKAISWRQVKPKTT